MEQLNLVWDLDVHLNELKTLKKELLNLESTSEIKNIEEKLINVETRLSKLKDSQDNIKRKLRESEGKLRDYNYKIHEIEKTLYNGEMNDIRQLEYLSSEKDNLKKTINNLEIEILEFMEEVDKGDQEIEIVHRSILLLKEENQKLKNQYLKFKKELNDKIKIEEQGIFDLKDKIDKDLLEKYIRIRKFKGTGIAKVSNSICSGCNMFVPTVLIERIYNTKDIVYCESCGRILCKP